MRERAPVRKEEHLDGDGQAKVQQAYQNQQHLARLPVCCAENWV